MWSEVTPEEIKRSCAMKTASHVQISQRTIQFAKTLMRANERLPPRITKSIVPITTHIRTNRSGHQNRFAPDGSSRTTPQVGRLVRHVCSYAGDASQPGSRGLGRTAVSGPGHSEFGLGQTARDVTGRRTAQSAYCVTHIGDEVTRGWGRSNAPEPISPTEYPS